MAHRTDSITIHDVIEFLQGFDKNDRFLTVIEKEDAFSFFCNLLPLIFRHASQSKLPPQGNSPPRIQRIQKIVALEGIFPELSSSPTYATTSEGSLSSEQNAAPDRNESPQRDTTLEDSEQNAAPDRNESSEHNTTLEDSEQNAAPDRSESSEHNTTLEGSQLLVQSVTQESTSPQQCTSIADNGLCADSSSLQDSAIELSDNEAEEDSLSSSSLLAEGSGEQRQITLGDSQTAANLIPITEDQGEEKTPGFATLKSTINVSSKFPLWSDSPESFWNYSEVAIEPINYDLITVPKTFVKDALDKKISNDIKRIQDRFYSIFVYKIYQKLMTSKYLSPALIGQFLDNLGLPSDPTTHLFCSRLLHGGRRRIDFCQRVTPDRHKIDYGILMIPELEDAKWERSDWRVRERCSESVALFKSQNIRSWSKSSGARSAANSIMFSRQPLLDYFQTQYDNIQGQKRRVEFTEGSSFKRIRSDPTTSQSPLQTSLVNDAQAAYNNAQAAFDNADAQAAFDNADAQAAFDNADAQAAFDNADAQAAYDNANQLNLSMRGDESTLISSVVSPNIYLPSIINSSSNGHNGMPLEESENNETYSATHFEGMGYQGGEFTAYFQGLGYQGGDNEELYNQLNWSY